MVSIAPVEPRRAPALRLTALLTGLLLALSVLAAPLAQAAPPAEGPGAQGDGPLSEFGSCLSRTGTGEIVILMDQSGSLARTDPQKARVQAAQYLVDRLASFSASSGVTLDARVAGFASSYRPSGSWTRLGTGSAGPLKSAITQAAGSLSTHDTDYWTALDSARSDLAGRGADSCRAIAWFSDGEYDIDPRQSAQARQDFGNEKSYAPGVSLDDEPGVQKALTAGRADICRPQGLADQLRSSGITLIGVGLDSGGTDFSFMRKVTEGGSDAGCGVVASPHGTFTTVSDLDSLLLAFDQMSTPGQTVRSSTVGICQGSICPDGEVSFTLDSSLDTVHALGSSGVDGLDAYVIAPGQAPVKVPGGQKTAVNSGPVTATWITPRSLQVDLARRDGAPWKGLWTIAFVDPSKASANKKAKVNLHLSSPLQLVLADAQKTPLRQGATISDAHLRLQDGPQGAEVPTSRIEGRAAVDVSLTDAGGRTTTLLSSEDVHVLDKPVALTIPRQAALGQATLTTSVQITTAAATTPQGQKVPGTTLEARRSEQRVSIQPPEDFPQVAGSIDFGRMEKDTTATGSVAVTGPGCVWVDSRGTRLTGSPQGAGTLTVASTHDGAGSCLRLARGQKASLPVTFTAQEAAEGAVTGTAVVRVAPDPSGARAQSVRVPFTADMHRPVNTGIAVVAFALALALGLGIPLALLYAMKAYAARIPAGRLATAVVPVEVPEDGSEPSVLVPAQDVTVSSLARPRRELTVGPYRLRARMGLWPTQPPRVELAAPEDPSISGATPAQRRGRAVLPVAARGTWVAVRDRGSARALSLLILSGDQSEQAIGRIVEDARRRLPAAVKALDPDRGPSGTGSSGAASAGSSGGTPPGSDQAPTAWGSSSGASSASATGESSSWPAPGQDRGGWTSESPPSDGFGSRP